MSTTLGSIRYDVDDGVIFGNDSRAITYDGRVPDGSVSGMAESCAERSARHTAGECHGRRFDYGQFYGTHSWSHSPMAMSPRSGLSAQLGSGYEVGRGGHLAQRRNQGVHTTTIFFNMMGCGFSCGLVNRYGCSNH